MPTRRTPFRPRLESLESRWTPAGGITAVLTAGNLTLTGDAESNSVLINQQSDDRLVLNPLGGTLVRFGNTGVFQPGPLTLPAPITGNVTINLLDGDDGLTVVQMRLPRALTVNGGNGNNSIAVQAVVVGGNLSVTGQEGDDATYFGGQTTVSGNVSVSHGNGTSLIDDFFGNMIVAGNMTLSNGNGPGSIPLETLASLEVCGQLSIQHGTDPNPNNTLIAPTSRLELGSLRVTNGPEADSAIFESSVVSIQRGTTIQNGSGGNLTRLTGISHLMTDFVSITNGDGDDTNTIQGDVVSVAGSVTINNGTGPGMAMNTISAARSLAISRNLSLRNGSGMDTNIVSVADPAGATHVSGDLSIQNGAGGSRTEIGVPGGDLVIKGPTQISSAAGDDATLIGGVLNSAVTLGRVTISSGDGSNQASLRGASLVVNGSLTLNGGTGTDRVQISSTTGNAAVTGNCSIQLGSGAGQSITMGAETAGRTFALGQGLSMTATGTGSGHFLALARVVVDGSTTLTTGEGLDAIRLEDSTLNALTIRTQGGNDQLYMEVDPRFADTTRIRGRLVVQLGSGEDLAIIGVPGMPQQHAIFAAASNSFDGGADHDELRIFGQGHATFFAGPPTTPQFEVVG